MKISVSAIAWTFEFRESHHRLLPELRENGLSAIEIPMFEPQKIAATSLRRAMEENDIECTVCAILPDGINPISEDAFIRQRSFNHLVECVEKAAELNARLLGGPLFAPIGYFPGRRPGQQEWDWAVNTFQKLGSTLNANRMILSIEPLNRSETFFLRTAKEARALCEAIDNPRIGVTLDTFHANIEEKSITTAVRDLGSYLKHIHASENDRGILGSGHVDFPAFIDALKEVDYDGFLVVEGFGYSPDEPNAPGSVWGCLDISPEDIAFRSADYLTNLVRPTAPAPVGKRLRTS